MSRYLQFLGTDGINVELSSVNYDPYEQVNYIFSLDPSFVNNNSIVIPSLVNTVEEQQKTLEEQQKTLGGKGTVASVTIFATVSTSGTQSSYHPWTLRNTCFTLYVIRALRPYVDTCFTHKGHLLYVSWDH